MYDLEKFVTLVFIAILIFIVGAYHCWSERKLEQIQKLGAQVERLFSHRKQSERTLSNKHETFCTLLTAIRHVYSLLSDVDLHMDGSTLNGFGTEGSDLDLCLIVYTDDKRLWIPKRRLVSMDEINITTLITAIEDNASCMRDVVYIGNAKVPILKGRDSRNRVLWEMKFNRTDALLKTRLLRAYSLLDWRVAPLVVTIKEWAGDHGVCSAYQQTLSSYSWTLLVICYLQCCSPPVLPCLHDDPKYAEYVTIDKVDVMDRPPYYQSSNTDNLGKLLRGFFDFYVNKFDVSKHVVSVRRGRLILKSQVNQSNRQWHDYFCIEEPYGTTTNTDKLGNSARSMFDRGSYLRVKNEMEAAYKQLMSFSPHLDTLNHI